MKRLTHRNEDGKAAVWVYADPDKPAEVIAAQRKAEEAVIEKLAHYEDLEEAGRLAVLPEGYCIKDLVYCASAEHCPSDFGLPTLLHCNHTDCEDCWEAVLKGGGQE